MKQEKLANGLTVYMVRNPAVPIVTLDMWVRVGSGDEPESLAGVSHFLEHMLFKGTERLAVGEYDRRVEGLGGYLNAATSYDYTHYYVTVPSEHVAAVLTDMADVITSSSLDAGELERERKVVLEEILRKNDSPYGFLYDEATRRAYAEGPYKDTVLGSSGSVSAITRDSMMEHYRRYYVPSNMALCICGDFDEGVILAQVHQLFGGIRAELKPWHDGEPVTAFARPQGRALPRAWEETYFLLTLPGPAPRTLHEMAVLDVAEALLVTGRSSRLVQELREKQQLVTRIDASLPSHRHPGLAMINGNCAPERLQEVRTAIFSEIGRMVAEGVSGGEMARAKRQLINGHHYQSETNAGKCSKLGYSYILLGNPSYLADYTAEVDSVTEREALEVYRKYVHDKDASLFVTGPQRLADIPLEGTR